MKKTVDKDKVEQLKGILLKLLENGYASKYSEVYVDDIMCTAEFGYYGRYMEELKENFIRNGFNVVEIDYASITVDVSKEAKSIGECFED